jgi:superfamily I DNA and/or RNA helicase
MDPSLRGHCLNTRVILNILKQTNYEQSIWEVLNTVSKIAEKVDVEDEWKELYVNAVRRSIHETNVVIANTAKAAEINKYQPAGMRFQPYLAIFDEAAQSTLADAFCVLSLNIQRLFLMGDTMQLTKDIKGDHDVLRISLLALMEPMERNIVVFHEQFRMHPEISQLLSYVRYGGKLFDGFKEEEEV